MTDDELTTYYSKLLILQYANKPNAVGTIKAYVKQLVASQIIQQVEDGFNLDNAVGVQLDALGTYRGANRTIVGIDLGKLFFSLPTYDDPDADVLPGFAVYADGDNIPQYWASYSDGQTAAYVLGDPDFRLLIKYLADLHRLPMTMKDIDDFLYKYFGTFVTMTDNEDMTMSYDDDPTDPNNLFKIANFINSLPHPAGVELMVTI